MEAVTMLGVPRASREQMPGAEKTALGVAFLHSEASSGLCGLSLALFALGKERKEEMMINIAPKLLCTHGKCCWAPTGWQQTGIFPPSTIPAGCHLFSLQHVVPRPQCFQHKHLLLVSPPSPLAPWALQGWSRVCPRVLPLAHPVLWISRAARIMALKLIHMWLSYRCCGNVNAEILD